MPAREDVPPRSRESEWISRYADDQVRRWLAQPAPQEEAVAFQSAGETVRGLLYLPGESARPAPAVLVAHGFTGSRNADARLLVWLARALAHNHIGALTIDFRGSGESAGDFAAMTPETEIADAKEALTLLAADRRIDANRLGMVGHSLGGLVTACTAGDDARLRAIALWCAVADLGRLAARLDDHAETRVADGWDAGGLVVGKAFQQTAREMAVLERFAGGQCPVLIAHGTADDAVPVDDAHRFVERAAQEGRDHELHLIEGANHCFQSLAHRLDLISTTVRWFAAQLLAAGA